MTLACNRLIPLLAALLCTAAGLHAQNEPAFGAFQFSNGVHPTIDATFENASEREVKRFWQQELKAISIKVSNRKEMTGEGARIPSASPDTLQVLVAVEKPRGGLYTTAHIAFLTTAGYVGPDSPDRERLGCSEWVRQRSVILGRQLAQSEVEKQQRRLADLNRELDMLGREQQRAENNIRRSRQRIEQAFRDSSGAAESFQALQQDPAMAGTDSTDQAAAEKSRTKEANKLQDRIRRSTSTRIAMEKKVHDLEWAIKQNQEAQVAKQAEIVQQQAVVEAAEVKLNAIH